MSENRRKCPALLSYFCKECYSEYPKEVVSLITSREERLRHFEKGEHITHQGAKMEHLMLLKNGKIRTEIVSDSGNSLFVAEHEAPYPIEASLLFAKDNHMMHDVIAVEECVVEYYSHKEVEVAMNHCHHFRNGFLAYNSELVKNLSERLQIFSIKKIRSKLVFYIFQHARADQTFEIPMSISSLADYFGVTRSALSRVFAEFRDEGAIEYANRKGKILDRRLLGQLGEL